MASTDEAVPVVRLNLNLAPDVAAVLKEVAARRGISLTEAVRRAIGVLVFVCDVQDAHEKILVTEGGSASNLHEVVFL